MTLQNRAILALTQVAIVLILIGLQRRRRLAVCYSFTAYLVTLLLFEEPILHWPERYFVYWYYTLKESIYGALKLAIAAELAYRVFRAFPGALARVRVAVGPLLVAGLVSILRMANGSDFAAVVSLSAPQVQAWTIWTLAVAALLAVYYNIPLDALHRAILVGLATYLGVFMSLLNVLRHFGFDRARVAIGIVDGYAFAAMIAWWLWAAWRPRADPALELATA